MRRRSAGFISLSLCMPERERAGGGASSPRPFLLSFSLAGNVCPSLSRPPSLPLVYARGRARASASAAAVLFRRRPSVRPSLFVRTGGEAGGGRLRRMGRENWRTPLAPPEYRRPSWSVS